MKAILTKFIPATNTRGSRIKAYDMDGNSVTVGYPHDERNENKHRYAALALCEKMGWTGGESLIEGSIKGGSVFVFPPNGSI